MSNENYSLVNKKLNGTSSLWKKKYTLLLKRCENVEKQDLRLINRLYQIKKLTQRLNLEKKFLVNRLERYNDGFRSTKFYVESELLPEGSSEYFGRNKSKNGNHHSNAKLAVSQEQEVLGVEKPPKKPMSAFFKYCQAQHIHMLKENASMSHDEIKTTLARKWSTMSSTEKDVYYESFQQECRSYEKGISEFLSNFKTAVEESGKSAINKEEEEEEMEEGVEEDVAESEEEHREEGFPDSSDVKKEQLSDMEAEIKEDIVEGNDHQQLLPEQTDDNEPFSNSSSEEMDENEENLNG